MTLEPKPVAGVNVRPSSPHDTPTHIRPEPKLPTFQFGLKHMFWFVTVVSLLGAAAAAAPGPRITPVILLLAALVVAFHIAGTTIGSRLREHADERLEWQSSQVNTGENLVVHPATIAAAIEPSVRSSWHARGQPIRWLPWLIAAGATVGGLVGACLLAFSIGYRTSPVGVAVGAISTAVVGGWIAFLGGSFWAILRQGWREALSEHQKDVARTANSP